jgi:hypothetical protein
MRGGNYPLTQKQFIRKLIARHDTIIFGNFI